MAISVLLGLGVAAPFEVLTYAFEVAASSPGAAAPSAVQAEADRIAATSSTNSRAPME
jgi:hypothetical protein